MLDDLYDASDAALQTLIAGVRQLARTVPIPSPAWVLERPAVVLTQVHAPLAAAAEAAAALGRLLVLEDAAHQVHFILSMQEHTTFLALEVKPAYWQVFEAQEIQVVWSAGDPASDRVLCRGRIVQGTVSWKLTEPIRGWQCLRCEVVHG